MHFTAFVTMLVALMYVWLGLQVAKAHRQFGVKLPKMYGNEDFERVHRAHMNALEWAPVFLPLLWLFAYYVSDPLAAALGLVWIGARVWYLIGYRESVEKRTRAFQVQAYICVALLLGSLGGLIWRVFHG
jgi:glutathione S-transferase